MNLPTCLGGNFTTGGDLAVDQVFARIVFGDLRRRLAGADIGAEIDPQLERRFARRGKFPHVDNRADAYVNFEKIVERDCHRRNGN